jgi:hypothetical protein
LGTSREEGEQEGHAPIRSKADAGSMRVGELGAERELARRDRDDRHPEPLLHQLSQRRVRRWQQRAPSVLDEEQGVRGRPARHHRRPRSGEALAARGEACKVCFDCLVACQPSLAQPAQHMRDEHIP